MLEINCKGKRTVGKANKGLTVKKKQSFKNFEKRKGWGGGGEENTTELQKPNVEAEVYNNKQNVN